MLHATDRSIGHKLARNIVDENYGLPENAMDDAETKTKRNRVATDQSAAFLCKVGAASDWNGRGSIESIRPGDRLSRSSRKLSAIAPLSTPPAIPSTRFLFSPLPRAISPLSITHVNRYFMLYLSSTSISRADIPHIACIFGIFCF